MRQAGKEKSLVENYTEASITYHRIGTNRVTAPSPNPDDCSRALNPAKNPGLDVSGQVRQR